jgi:rhodanese-related sulfurtransferase
MNPAELSVDSPMGEIMDALPGARRALFSRYHLGGCQSCGFAPTETLAELAARAAEAPPEEMLAHILTAHEHDQAMLVSPTEAKALLESESPPLLLDTRTREEHEAVAIPGSEFMDQEYQQRLFSGPADRAILLYDHAGKHVLDTCSWFQGHGLKNTRAITGGIDTWSQQIDSSLRRYRLEVEA